MWEADVRVQVLVDEPLKGCQSYPKIGIWCVKLETLLESNRLFEKGDSNGVATSRVKLVFAGHREGENENLDGSFYNYKLQEAAQFLNQLSGKFRKVQFRNIRVWDGRFNYLLTMLHNRCSCLSFKPSAYIATWVFTLQTLLMTSNSNLTRLSLKNSVIMPRHQVAALLHCFARMPSLETLTLGIGIASVENNESFRSCSDIASQFSDFTSLKDFRVVGVTFETMMRDGNMMDLLWAAVNHTNCESVSFFSTKDYDLEVGKRYYLNFCNLQDTVCMTSSLSLHELHLRGIRLLPNTRRVIRECNHVGTLDLVEALGLRTDEYNASLPCEGSFFRGICEDLLKLFPSLVFCRLDCSRVCHVAPFIDYLNTKGCPLRELHLALNFLDLSEFELVLDNMLGWRNLKILNLRGNPFEKDLNLNGVRERYSSRLAKSSFHDFFCFDLENATTESPYVGLTGWLCIHQYRSMLTSIRDDYADRGIPAGLWSRIIRRVHVMESARYQIVNNGKQLDKTYHDGTFRASNYDSLENDKASVIFWLLSGPIAAEGLLLPVLYGPENRMSEEKVDAVQDSQLDAKCDDVEQMSGDKKRRRTVAPAE